ncbi:MAG: class I SAM-dependent methyltransferase [Pseudohongiellaceae bacterium]
MKKIVLAAMIFIVSSASFADGHLAIERAVKNSTRPEADTARDATRKPAEVLEFFGIEEGMKVLDIFAGGGYYSEILSHVVGEQGEVTLYNNGGWDGFVGAGVADRLADDRLPNVKSLVTETDETMFNADYYDAAVFVLGFHDLYYAAEGWPAIDAESFLSAVYDSIKPGGVVGIVDHAATLGVALDVANTLHRIDPLAIQHGMVTAGFILEGESGILRNPDDDRLKSMSDPSIRGNTDRVVYLFRKPS